MYIYPVPYNRICSRFLVCQLARSLGAGSATGSSLRHARQGPLFTRCGVCKQSQDPQERETPQREGPTAHNHCA